MMQDTDETELHPNICTRCGAHFICGIAIGLERCWCFELPRLSAPDVTDGAHACLCPQCLRRAIVESARTHSPPQD